MDVLYLTPDEIQLLDNILGCHWHICCREAFDGGLREKLENHAELNHDDWWAMDHALTAIFNSRFPQRQALIAIQQRIKFMDRSERPRPNSYKPEPSSELAETARLYNISNKRNVLTLVFTHPSISLYPLSKLLYEACNTGCGFDRGISLYDACVAIHREPLNVKDYDADECLKDYSSRSKAMHLRMRSYYLLNLIANGGYGIFFIHSVGFMHEAEPFISMIRDFMEDDIRNIQIIFLSKKDLNEGECEMLQYEQFKRLKELEDGMLWIEDLQDDPVQFLLKFRPQSYPDVQTINKLL